MKNIVKDTVLATAFTFVELGKSFVDLCVFSAHGLGLTKVNPFENTK